MSFKERVGLITQKPLEAIQGITALSLAIFGLYLASPLYVPSTPTSSNTAWGEGLLVRTIFCLVFFILPALPTILGWFIAKFRTKRWRSRSCFYMFVGIACLTLLRIMAVGIFPPIWLFYLAMGLVSAILYLHWQVK